MAEKDKHIVRIAFEFTWLESTARWPRPESELGFSRQRWDEYRSLFRKLGIKNGLSREGTTDTIFLAVSATGMATGGAEKGYAYSTNPKNRIFDSLDAISTDELPSLQPGFKRLEGNWYIYYLWDD